MFKMKNNSISNILKNSLTIRDSFLFIILKRILCFKLNDNDNVIYSG